MFRMRDLARTLGLNPHFCWFAAPLHAPIEHHHPIQRYPDSNPLRGLGQFSHYLPASVSVLRCAAARLVCMQSLPVHTDFHTHKRQQSLEVQSVRARQSAKVKALGNRFKREKSCTDELLIAKLKGKSLVTVPAIDQLP
jgi:hypothetical protein